MCTNYVPAEYDDLSRLWSAQLDVEGIPVETRDFERFWEVSAETLANPQGGRPTWPAVTYQDYPAPIIVSDGKGGRLARIGTFGLTPLRRLPEGSKRYSTMNAREETVARKPSYATYWKEQSFCLIPMASYFEPNWESGKAIRWEIGLQGGQPFAVAGLWRSWPATDNFPAQYSFAMLTMNCDEHPLLNRMHKPPEAGEPPDKRALIVISPENYDAWLNCRSVKKARGFFNLVPAENMYGNPNPLKTKATKALADPPAPKKKTAKQIMAEKQLDLFADQAAAE